MDMDMDEEEVGPGDDNQHGALANVAKGMEAMVSGLPVSVRKNAGKAFGQLCTSAMNVSTTWFETKANEIRAVSEAKIQLIKLTGQQIGTQLKVDTAYGDAASEKFAQRIVRKQKNLDDIGRIAAEQLRVEPVISGSEEQDNPISEDWLNAFENEAGEKSSAEMKNLFGKILAGEITRPKSFSIKTLKLISELDNRAAVKFRELCSVAITLEHEGKLIDVRVAGFGNAGNNTLTPYGLPYRDLNLLAEHGLVLPEYNSWLDYGVATAFNGSVDLPFKYAGQHYVFMPLTPSATKPTNQITGVTFTNSGTELLNIVEKQPNPKYFEAFKEYFKALGFDVIPIKLTPKEMSE